MLHNINMQEFNNLMHSDSSARTIIQQLLDNHHTIISTISHELRNPLTLVFSTLQILEYKQPELRQNIHWNQLKSHIDYMKLLLEELSSFNNGAFLNCAPFDMKQLLKNIVLSFILSLNEKEKETSDITFTSSISPEIGNIKGDKLKLTEVLLNLLKNAKESITGTGCITLSAYYTVAFLTIEISDTGCGIPDSYLKTIFEPFQTYKPDGTGLGLALAKRIVEAHHGTISVTSTVGTGSTFYVTLPVQ